MTREERKAAKRRLIRIQGAEYENRSACASACAALFVGDLSGCYLHTIGDIVRVLRRKGYSVRSRRSSVPRRVTVGQLRARLAGLEPGAYLVRVPGHALVMAHDGRTYDVAMLVKRLVPQQEYTF